MSGYSWNDWWTTSPVEKTSNAYVSMIRATEDAVASMRADLLRVARAWSTRMVYDVRGLTGYAYDLDRGQGRLVPVWTIRATIAHLIGCPTSNSHDGDDHD
jgi:hypothetical protein